MSPSVELGKVIHGDGFKDAVHVALFPAVSAVEVWGGDKVVVHRRIDGVNFEVVHAPENEPGDGVVDPFLPHVPVKAGERFYVLLYPGTVTALRHVYTHPALSLAPRGFPSAEKLQAARGEIARGEYQVLESSP